MKVFLGALATAVSCLACDGSPDVPSAPPPTVLVITVSRDTLLEGEAASFRLLERSGATERVADGAKWRSSDTTIASVNTVGLVLGVAPGTTTIVGQSGSRTAEAAVHVRPNKVGGVLLSVTDIRLDPGEQRVVTATPIHASGAPMPGRPVAWLSSDETIVEVSGGTLRAVRSGVTLVHAISEEYSASVRVRVSGPAGPVDVVTVDPAAATLSAGDTLSLSVLLEDAEGDVAHGRLVDCHSSDPGVVAVLPGPRITALAPGRVTVTCSSEGKSAEMNALVVSPSALIQLKASRPDTTVIVGDTLDIFLAITSALPVTHGHSRVLRSYGSLEVVPTGARGTGKPALAGTLDTSTIPYGLQTLHVVAFNTAGDSAIFTFPFIRGARAGKGGTTLPPRSK